MILPEHQVYGLPPGFPGARQAAKLRQMFGIGLPPGLPGARYYPGLGQQVSPRGFGQQMSASGRVAGKSGRNGGMFGLGQEAPKETNWLAIGLGITAAVAGIGLIICLTSKRSAGVGGGMSGLGETKAARAFIAKKVKKLHSEGYKGKQAVAIAYSMARKKGYDVPKK